MTKQKIFILLLSILSLHCSTSKQATESNTPTNQLTEADIYAKILKEYLGQAIGKGEKVKSLVLNKKIQDEQYGMELSYGDIVGIIDASPDLLIFDEDNNIWPDSAKIDLFNKFENSTTRKQVNFEKIKLPYRIELLSPQAINKIFKEDVEKGWKEFYKKRPKSFGIVELSNLVFSDDKRFCMLYIGYTRRGLHGYGGLVIVDLLKDKDIFIAEIELWMS